MNLLGLDYGSKKIGLAIAYKEDNGFIVVGYETLDNNKFVVQNLLEIIQKENIITVVVGLPLGLKGQKTPQTIETEDFINTLMCNLSVSVVIEDERFTSILADQLVGSNANHEGAAKLILEGYIAKQKQ